MRKTDTVLVFCLAREGLYAEINSEQIQLFWEGIRLVSANGSMFKLPILNLMNFIECPSKKEIFPTLKLISTGHIFPVFFMEYIGYQLHNSTFRCFYGAIRSDLSGS